MIGPERSAILPLRETSAVPLANGNPVMLTNGFSRAGVSLLEPRDHERRFWFELAVAHVVIRQCAVERILTRSKSDGNVIPPPRGVGIVQPDRKSTRLN